MFFFPVRAQQITIKEAKVLPNQTHSGKYFTISIQNNLVEKLFLVE
jgi:hypothetical protein